MSVIHCNWTWGSYRAWSAFFRMETFCMSHPSTHIDLIRDAISFKVGLFNRILIFGMELSRNNGIRDYLRESI